VEYLLEQGKLDEAISLLGDLHKNYPQEESILFRLALAFYDRGDSEKAEKHFISLFEKELQREVFTGFAFDELIRIYKKEHRNSQLVEICERTLAAHPEDVGVLTELAHAYLKLGNATGACAIYQKLIEREEDHSVFYSQWGEALFAAGFLKESEEAFYKAGEMDPEQADRYYFKMAVLLQDAGKYEDAIQWLTKCVSVKLSDPLYYCAMGDSLIALERLEEAFAVYQEAIGHDPVHAGAYYNRLGNTFLRNGHLREAARAFEKAIEEEPLKTYFLNLADVYKKMGFPEQADEILHWIEKVS
jgi:tetratricopeptide (TPR) repeat protein